MARERKCKVPPYQGDEHYVFFSYCHADKETAYPVIEALRGAGLRVWYDQGIVAGAEWPVYIAEKLQGADACLVCMSKAADESINCNRELAFAAEKRLNVIVVYLEPCNVGLGTQLLTAGRQSCKAYEMPIGELVQWCHTSQEIRDCWGDPPVAVRAKQKPVVSLDIDSWTYDGHFDSAGSFWYTSNHTDPVTPQLTFFRSDGAQLQDRPIHAGHYKIRAFWQETENYTEIEKTVEFRIEKCPVTIRVPDAELTEGEHLANFRPAVVEGDTAGSFRDVELSVEADPTISGTGTWSQGLRIRVGQDQLAKRYPDYRITLIPGALTIRPAIITEVSRQDPIVPTQCHKKMTGTCLTVIEMKTGERRFVTEGKLQVGSGDGNDITIEGACSGVLLPGSGEWIFLGGGRGWYIDGSPVPSGIGVSVPESCVLSVGSSELALFTGQKAQVMYSRSRICALKSLEQNEWKFLEPGKTPCGKAHNDLWKRDVMPMTDRTLTGLHHCDIVIDEEGTRLHDWKSTNGTFLNGVRMGVKVGLEEWAELTHGDLIRMGHQTFQFWEHAYDNNGWTGPQTQGTDEVPDSSEQNEMPESQPVVPVPRYPALERAQMLAGEYETGRFADYEARTERWKQDMEAFCENFRSEQTELDQSWNDENEQVKQLAEQIEQLQKQMDEAICSRVRIEAKRDQSLQECRRKLAEDTGPDWTPEQKADRQNWLEQLTQAMQQAEVELQEQKLNREDMDEVQESALEKALADMEKLRGTKSVCRMTEEDPVEKVRKQLLKMLLKEEEPESGTEDGKE